MSFISAIPPNDGSGISDYRATSLTGRHPFDSTPAFVGTMKNDSSVLHGLRGLSNARYFRQRLITREALPDGALRASGKVCRRALHEAETLRRLHEVKRRCVMPRSFAPKKRVFERAIAHTGLVGTPKSPQRAAFSRKTFARVSSDRSFRICVFDRKRGAPKCFIGDNFMRNRFTRAKRASPKLQRRHNEVTERIYGANVSE